jgi:WD40 repeat protein/DNA-binding SARP family transcriptional activator
MLEIRTFGGLQLTTGGQTITGLASRKAEALLVYLAVTGRPHSREVLANFLWDERSQTQSLANLRTVLSSLRQNIGDYLEISREYAAISPDAEVWLDLQEFEQQLGAAQLEKAISIYHGEFLEGFNIRDSRGFEDWQLQERTRCQKRLQEGLHAWVLYHIERGSFQEGITYAEQLLRIDPLDEAALRQLLTLLTLSGQRAALTRRYEEFCALLESELGVDPSRQSQDHYQALLDGSLDHTLSSDAPVLDVQKIRAVGDCPYRGLAHFREVDAPFFFGRETFTDHLQNAIHNGSVVTVILGASGAGKSSAVYAGLLPRLRQAGSWQIISLRPGRQPFNRLAAALVPFIGPGPATSSHLDSVETLAFEFQHTPGALKQSLYDMLAANRKRNILLLIDQFEELYTLCQQSEVQHRFLDELLDAVNGNPIKPGNGVVLIQTLRADFMGQALAYRPFADTLQKAALMLGPMTRDELRMVIEKPAEKQGAAFEPGLVERILNDVGEEPGTLPLLEFALTLLWERLDQGWFTHTAYEDIGHVAGALTRYAEEVFSTLDESDQDQLRRIFVQLVQPGEGAEDTRRVAAREELVGTDWDLIQHLADKRLVVTNLDQEGGQTVEVVHEALIRTWDRLGSWMEEDRAFRTWQEGLRMAIRQWEENQEDEGGLLRGRPLAQAEAWLTERPTELSAADQRFIQASMDLRDRREQERARLRRRIFAGLGAGLVILMILAGVAFYQRNQSIEAYSMSLAAHVQNALDNKENDLALALALAASEIDNPPPIVARMLRQSAYAPGPIAQIDIEETFGMDQMPWAMDISPTSLISLIGFHDGTLILWDVMEAREIRRFEGHTDVVSDVVFSPDGTKALSASYDTTAIVWEVETGEILSRFEGHNGLLRGAAFSPDGKTVATGGFVGIDAEDIVNPGELIIWDPRTGEEISRLEGHPSAVEDLEFSHDGTKLLASSGMFSSISNLSSLYYWDLSSKEIIFDIPLESDAYDLEISPDGSKAAYGTISTVEIIDLETGSTQSTISDFSAYPRSVNWSPLGDMLVTIDSNGKFQVWGYPTLAPIAQAHIHLHQSGSWSESFYAGPRVSLSPDGRYAVSVADDNQLVIWDLKHAGEIRSFYGHQDFIGGISITPDGQYILSGSGSYCFCGAPGQDNIVRFWNAQTGELIHELEGHTDLVTYTDMTPDGKRGITASVDSSARVWDLEKGELIWAFEDIHPGVWSAVISPDGSTALTTGISDTDASLKYWNLETGELIREIEHPNEADSATKLMFTGDGLTAYGGMDHLTKVDLTSGETTVYPQEESLCCVGFALSSDYKTCYGLENADGTLRSWDIESGKIIHEFGYHEGNRSRVEISADDTVLMSSVSSGKLYLWDPDTGEMIRTWTIGGFNIDIDMTADGKLAVTQGPNYSLVLHNLDLPIEVDEVKAWIEENRVVRELTCEERLTYSIEPLCD